MELLPDCVCVWGGGKADINALMLKGGTAVTDSQTENDRETQTAFPISPHPHPHPSLTPSDSAIVCKCEFAKEKTH